MMRRLVVASFLVNEVAVKQASRFANFGAAIAAAALSANNIAETHDPNNAAAVPSANAVDADTLSGVMAK